MNTLFATGTRRLGALSAVLAAGLLLSACASTPKTPEEQVSVRAKQRWDALIKRDFEMVFAEGVERNIGRFARVIGTLGDDQAPDAAQRAQAMAMLSSMVGALVLARATVAANPALSDEILETVKAHLLAIEGQPR